jgi:5,10-methenyltetrahydrofolate synthetase
MSTKGELRQKLKVKRYQLIDADHTRGSRAIVERLINSRDWSQVKTIHYFEPIHELLEVDTAGFITYIEDNCPDIQLFVPHQVEGQWEMISLKDGQPPDQFDAVIVPMLGFDPKSLHRIGYGGGYYDKFLATQPDAQKIGVCFELGKLEDIPAEPHDIPLNLIITEVNSYKV